ncbi:peptidoglycan-binding protein [Buttiauxella massiliensis]|uniref:peptidoglycan-binding protein n=1 Tax=Buttiauxella massiliensis TaxID=2831590 RepID=UPI00125FE62C|nr:peptidoglycan-binding protein [Buttiauxella massiliensis]
MSIAKTVLLMRGNSDQTVADLKKALLKTLDNGKITFPGLASGKDFNADTETALRAWQSSVGLVADGIAGPRTLTALGITPSVKLAVIVDNSLVAKLFPFTRTSNIASNLPYVTAALAAFNLTDANLVAAALGTIRAETEGFMPIAELPSHFNTLPGQLPFSKYENKLGNNNPGDGARYRGRGFVQLTGRENYEKYGKLLDIALAENPDSACAPEVAACLLAAFIGSHRERLSTALAKGDLKAARQVVNGGSHGLDRFTDTYQHAQKLWSTAAQHIVNARAKNKGQATVPATTRRSSLNVSPDAADLRDRPYMPPPVSLPQNYPNDKEIAHSIGTYTKAGLILDQGLEGACTGFGLACVINYLRWRMAGMPSKMESVSPRMLYKFARRFDEYEGENYDGSSCRGALKGWYNNGVCLESNWRYDTGDDALPTAGWDTDAVERTLGVYYRIDPKAITDLQAAILEIGAIYVSSYTHHGWEGVKTSNKPPSSHTDLPLIHYDGKPSRSGGHAFALVGFNRVGFVLQNSWGHNWGAGGFAVISYTDWLAHGMDVWVAAMGMPGVISDRLASGCGAQQLVAATGTTQGNWWDEQTAYQHSIVLGNNGRVDRFDKLDGVTRTLQNQACVLPDTWFRQNEQPIKRLVIYAHGGLNSEGDAIKRAQAMGRYFLGNGCYPLFLIWKSGLLESLGDILADKTRPTVSPMAGSISSWLTNNISDPIIEKTIGRPLARPLWSEMKENAELATESGRGGDLLSNALHSLASSWGDKFELHLIGHSAGSIVLGRLLNNLEQKKLIPNIKSVNLYAPACTVAFANRYYATQTKIMSRLYLDILSDPREQEDNVATIYQKSLLYFVSNALEADLRMPILGLENVYKPEYTDWDGSSISAETLTNWRNAMEISNLRERLTIHEEEKIIMRRATADGTTKKTKCASHGGFDNNIEVIEQTLKRITGGELTLQVDDLIGF